MNKKFNERLKELRKKHCLTQTELAQKTHISQSAISSYELRKTKPTDKVIIVFAKFFAVSSDYLLGLED